MSRQAYNDLVAYVDDITGALMPADLVEVFVYKGGTSELASIFESRTGSTPLANPFIAPENGRVAFWADSGDYDVKYHDTKVPARFGDELIGWQSSPVQTSIPSGELSNSGDITWTQDPESGAWIPQFKENSVGAAEIAAGAVGESEVADGSISSRKFKPTSGIVYGEGGVITLTSSYADITKASLEITPSVASKIKIIAVFALEVNGGVPATTVSASGIINLDGVDKTEQNAGLYELDPSTETILGASVVAVYLLSLTAAKHTIKMRAKKSSGNSAKADPNNSYFYYDLMAS